ncbi:MAG: ribonuclease P protein component [Patescibacteria group bacterium]|jgi:ribonuclease P protein component
MLKKGARLISTYEFNKTRRLGKSCTGKHSRVFYLKLGELSQPTRIGIVVTNRFNASAVKRNRIKRIYREILRKEYETLSPGYWIVVHPRDEILEVPYEEISTDLNTLLQKVSILR